MNEIVKISTNKDIISSLCEFLKKNLKFDTSPKLRFLINKKNEKDCFGKTAFYDPEEQTISIYISGRHIKDILRSIAHETVHHAQNCRGEFDKMSSATEGYAQTNPHLREMEKEAYLTGNIMFRDFEDSAKYVKRK